jgi:hypothetical protein
MIRNENGQVLVFVALAILVILGLAALGIDVGFMYSVRHELQRSADAGALAGASRFVEADSAWSANPGDPVMVQADARARQFAAMDPVAAKPLDPTTEVAVAFPSQDRVRVTTRRTVPLFFARVLGRTNQQISATAVAEAAVADTGVQCLKPWMVPLPWNDLETPPNLTFNPEIGEQPIPLPNIPTGEKFIVKIGEPFNKNGQVDLPSLQQESGHFFAIDLCGDTGASAYRDRIQSACRDACSVSLGDYLTLEPGNMVGPTKQGVDGLMGLDPAAKWNPDPAVIADPNMSGEWVTGSKFSDWRQSPRLVKIPIYDPSELLSQGKTDIKVAGFAGFWIEGYETKQGTVTGYFVPATALGSSNQGPTNGPVLRVLRLVE